MKIGIIMGSDSDLPVMKQAAEFLEEFEIPYEMTIISAHRAPDKLYGYVKTAIDRGISVIIAGAGGAAHLPGVAASLTTLPVIGVPIHSKALGGMDSLYSIVQMPAGIPVATVAIDGAKNAAILAASILSVSQPEIAAKLARFKADLADTVATKAKHLDAIGYREYLKEKN